MSSSTTSRHLSRGSNRERIRRRIIASATKLFVECGYTTTSVDRIAEHAGFTRGAVQRQFGSKSALADAVLDRFYRHVLHQATEQIGAVQTGHRTTSFDEFVHLVIRWIEAAVMEPAWVRLELDLAAERGYLRHGQVDTISGAPERLACLRNLMVHLLAMAASALGVELVVEPETIVTGLVAVVVGVTVQNEDPAVAAELVRPLVRHLLRAADPADSC